MKKYRKVSTFQIKITKIAFLWLSFADKPISDFSEVFSEIENFPNAVFAFKIFYKSQDSIAWVKE